MTVLYDGAIARVTFEDDCLSIEAVKSGLAIDSETVRHVLTASDGILANDKPFQCMWDLTFCPVPDVRTVVRAFNWAIKNKSKLFTLNTALAVVVPTRPAIRAIVRHTLSAFGPRCPTLVTDARDEATAFLDQHKVRVATTLFPAALIRV